MTENSRRSRSGEHDPESASDGLDEPSSGTLTPNDELEAALREASASYAAREAAEEKGEPPTAAGSADKVTIEALSAELRSLTTQHSESLAELETLKEQYLRLQAEFDNFRRRGLKERQEAHQFGHQNLVKDLLPAVDNLERAVAHVGGSGAGDLQALAEGVELVLRDLLGGLAKHGVKVVEAEGESFDPAVQEAMAQVPNDSLPDNSVVEVLQKGYLLHDRMLRPARVVVSKATDENAPEGAEH